MKYVISLGLKMVRGILGDSTTFWCLHGGKIDCTGLTRGYLISVWFFSMEQWEAFGLWHLDGPIRKNQEESDPRAPFP